MWERERMKERDSEAIEIDDRCVAWLSIFLSFSQPELLARAILQTSNCLTRSKRKRENERQNFLSPFCSSARLKDEKLARHDWKRERNRKRRERERERERNKGEELETSRRLSRIHKRKKRRERKKNGCGLLFEQNKFNRQSERNYFLCLFCALRFPTVQ